MDDFSNNQDNIRIAENSRLKGDVSSTYQMNAALNHPPPPLPGVFIFDRPNQPKPLTHVDTNSNTDSTTSEYSLNNGNLSPTNYSVHCVKTTYSDLGTHTAIETNSHLFQSSSNLYSQLQSDDTGYKPLQPTVSGDFDAMLPPEAGKVYESLQPVTLNVYEDTTQQPEPKVYQQLQTLPPNNYRPQEAKSLEPKSYQELSPVSLNSGILQKESYQDKKYPTPIAVDSKRGKIQELQSIISNQDPSKYTSSKLYQQLRQPLGKEKKPKHQSKSKLCNQLRPATVIDFEQAKLRQHHGGGQQLTSNVTGNDPEKVQQNSYPTISINVKSNHKKHQDVNDSTVEKCESLNHKPVPYDIKNKPLPNSYYKIVNETYVRGFKEDKPKVYLELRNPTMRQPIPVSENMKYNLPVSQHNINFTTASKSEDIKIPSTCVSQKPAEFKLPGPYEFKLPQQTSPNKYKLPKILGPNEYNPPDHLLNPLEKRHYNSKSKLGGTMNPSSALVVSSSSSSFYGKTSVTCGRPKVPLSLPRTPLCYGDPGVTIKSSYYSDSSSVNIAKPEATAIQTVGSAHTSYYGHSKLREELLKPKHADSRTGVSLEDTNETFSIEDNTDYSSEKYQGKIEHGVSFKGKTQANGFSQKNNLFYITAKNVESVIQTDYLKKDLSSENVTKYLFDSVGSSNGGEEFSLETVPENLSVAADSSNEVKGLSLETVPENLSILADSPNKRKFPPLETAVNLLVPADSSIEGKGLSLETVTEDLTVPSDSSNERTGLFLESIPDKVSVPSDNLNERTDLSLETIPENVSVPADSSNELKGLSSETVCETISIPAVSSNEEKVLSLETVPGTFLVPADSSNETNYFPIHTALREARSVQMEKSGDEEIISLTNIGSDKAKKSTFILNSLSGKSNSHENRIDFKITSTEVMGSNENSIYTTSNSLKGFGSPEVATHFPELESTVEEMPNINQETIDKECTRFRNEDDNVKSINNTMDRLKNPYVALEVVSHPKIKDSKSQLKENGTNNKNLCSVNASVHKMSEKELSKVMISEEKHCFSNKINEENSGDCLRSDFIREAQELIISTKQDSKNQGINMLEMGEENNSSKEIKTKRKYTKRRIPPESERRKHTKRKASRALKEIIKREKRKYTRRKKLHKAENLNERKVDNSAYEQTCPEIKIEEKVTIKEEENYEKSVLTSVQEEIPRKKRKYTRRNVSKQISEDQLLNSGERIKRKYTRRKKINEEAVNGIASNKASTKPSSISKTKVKFEFVDPLEEGLISDDGEDVVFLGFDMADDDMETVLGFEMNSDHEMNSNQDSIDDLLGQLGETDCVTVECDPQSLLQPANNTTSCCQCNQVFQSHMELVDHMQWHAATEKRHTDSYGCSLCSKDFPTELQLDKHMKRIHNEGKKHQCPVCTKKFTTSAYAKRHAENAHKEEEEQVQVTFYCGECTATFPTEAELKEHENKVHRKTLHQCEKCLKYFVKFANLQRHKQSHEEEGDGQTFPCAYCNQKFSSRELLHAHWPVHTDKKCYTCDICDGKFTALNSLKRHRVSHGAEKLFRCEICQKSFALLSTLKTHLLIHTGAKRFDCKLCGKKFNRKDVLNAHQWIHTGEKKFQCDICQQKFRWRHAVKSHKLIYHSKERPYSCHICGKRFSHPDSFKKHAEVHAEKLFYCQICLKAFSRPSTLKAHIIIHTDLKPFYCDMCNRGFRSKSHLRNHLLVHTKDKPWLCKFCNKTYKDRNQLRRHKRIVHCRAFYKKVLPELPEVFQSVDNFEMMAAAHDSVFNHQIQQLSGQTDPEQSDYISLPVDSSTGVEENIVLPSVF